MGKHDHFADSDVDFLAQLDQQVEQTHHSVVAEPAGTDADFLARLDRQVEQAHQDIATTYTYARRDTCDAHTAKPR